MKAITFTRTLLGDYVNRDNQVAYIRLCGSGIKRVFFKGSRRQTPKTLTIKVSETRLKGSRVLRCADYDFKVGRESFSLLDGATTWLQRNFRGCNKLYVKVI